MNTASALEEWPQAIGGERGAVEPPRPTTQTLRDIDLAARYDLGEREVLINGAQALVRMLLMQRNIDARAGVNSAGYVSGYRGSPLGSLDMELWKAKASLQASAITFQPGVNEDLAATAIWGTQQIDVIGQPSVDGVFALWYGKGPGVDRAGDALKHANYAGTHPRGGVLAVFGDDHPGKSSTVAHHSEQAMAANGIPVLYPSNVQEIVQFGLLSLAMSRYCGSWASMKLVNETAEQTAVIDVDWTQFRPELPDAGDLLPPEGVHFRGAYAPLRDEAIMVGHRLPLAQRFARANALDRVTVGQGGTWGIVSAGKAYQDVCQALGYFGIDDAQARALGIAVYKVGMIWPLEPAGLRAFASGRGELMFIEEKAAFLEKQAASILYNDSVRPRLVGKTDMAAQPLISLEKPLEPVEIAAAIAVRLKENGLWNPELEKRLKNLDATQTSAMGLLMLAEKRVPYFCSGCPHNTSTNLPSGSIAMAGIGCHGMAIWAKPNTFATTQMGAEGMNWVGAHRFTKIQHIFQNLGDGTYFHSGILAIRAAVASDANITYKILFNGAVAMTGGQPVDGELTVARVAHQVIHEGVKRVVVLTDEIARYGGDAGLPTGVDVFDRSDLNQVQLALRQLSGCTVIIYDQTCAADKRRRRNRGQLPEPDKRVFIHSGVCEGCGDCSAKSGCVSIEPTQTALGTKRMVNQSSCNKDYSCVTGFCPSFVTVSGAKPRKPGTRQLNDDVFAGTPVPPTAAIGDSNYAILIAGIGGTGVITVSAILAMAAHLEFKAPSTYDMTGLSQKNGAVYSHLRIARSQGDIASQRIGIGEAALVLAFDMIAALGEDSKKTFSHEKTVFLANDRVQETSAFVGNVDAKVDTRLLQRKVEHHIGAGRAAFVDASGWAQALFADTIASNMFMLGVAAQKGWLPIGIDAIEKAIKLNATQVDLNTRAFRAGRLWEHSPETVRQLAGNKLPERQELVPRSLKESVATHQLLLTRYQNAAYAGRYADLVEMVDRAERQLSSGDDALTKAVAENFGKLMAYKDEYEVARLYAAPEFMNALHATFEGNLKIRLNLAPPMFSRRDPVSGVLLKREFGPWMLWAMKALAKLKPLRHTRLDPFGRTAERRTERALIVQYESDLKRICLALSAENLHIAIDIAALPQKIRGYGHVKDAAIRKVETLREALLNDFDAQSRAALAGREMETSSRMLTR